MKQLLTLILAFGLILNIGYAQQDPLFTQYAFNQVALNPGVAGTHDALSLTAMSRIQWNDIAGAPQTHIFSGHMPLNNGNMGLGVTFFNDEIGVSRQNELGFVYAYQLEFENSKLSFGARTSFSTFRADYADVDLGNIFDPEFSVNTFNDFGINFGAGAYYYSDNYYVGLSVPNLTRNTYSSEFSSDLNFVRDRVYYLLAGYVFDLSADFKLKPYTNIRVAEGSPIQIDLNASVIYKEQVYLGIGVRPNSSVSAMFEWQIDRFRLGYAADFLNNDASAFGRAANEFLLNYVIPTSKKRTSKFRSGSSRFF